MRTRQTRLAAAVETFQRVGWVEYSTAVGESVEGTITELGDRLAAFSDRPLIVRHHKRMRNSRILFVRG